MRYYAAPVNVSKTLIIYAHIKKRLKKDTSITNQCINCPLFIIKTIKKRQRVWGYLYSYIFKYTI